MSEVITLFYRAIKCNFRTFYSITVYICYSTRKRSAIIITHYQKLLDYVEPDVVHVLKAGKIVRTGGREIVDIIETQGFDSF